MPIIELALSEELDKAINSISTDKKKFILEAVKQKLKEAKIETIKDELIEGYKNSRKENLSLMEDFKHVDLEHWDDY